MAKKETNRTYEEIERPYDNNLDRSDKTVEGTDSVTGGNTEITEIGTRETILTGGADNGAQPNGSAEIMPVKSEGGIGDIWIRNFIRSKNWAPKKRGFNIDGLTGNAEFSNVYISGHIEALTGTIGGFTITETELYGGIIKTAATVAAGSSGVIMDTDGLRGYDSVLGKTFDLPTDGSAPSFASGVINSTVFEIDTSAVMRTSSTVGDGSASSDGILINDTGFYACETNQLLANANVKILVDGTASFSGTITAAAGTIGGTTISATSLTGGVIQTASSGERIEMRADTKRINLVNSSASVVATLNYGTGSTNAIFKVQPSDDARRAIEIIIPSSFATGTESDAKAITIANAADSITIDITNGGLVGLAISTCDTSAIQITQPGTNAATLDFTFSSSSYPIIDMIQGGTSTNSYGIRITQGTSALKEGIFIDNNASSNLAEAIYIDRDSNSTSDAAAMRIDSSNAGTGDPIGIDFSNTTQAVMKVAIDAGSIGAIQGRIPIYVGGTLRYIAYYAS